MREKIAQEIYRMNKFTPFGFARPLEWDELLESTRENMRKQADRILTLLHNEEITATHYTVEKRWT